MAAQLEPCLSTFATLGYSPVGDVTLNKGRNFAVFFFNSGPRAGELASAFIPDSSQLAQIINLVK
jgi:hypothetical protein